MKEFTEYNTEVIILLQCLTLFMVDDHLTKWIWFFAFCIQGLIVFVRRPK